MNAYVEFEFDLPGALLHRLVSVLDGMDSAPLTAENLREVQEEQGVYQLLLDDEVVYIGKTDADAGLLRRLTRHSRKILYRRGLNPSRVSFKAVRIFVFTAVDLETDLIRHYGGERRLSWNGSGFGSNDPGRERDTTRVHPDNYDALYPIDIDRPLAFAIEQDETAAAALYRLKEALPFTIRYQGLGGRSRKPHPDLAAALLSAAPGPMSAREAVEWIVRALPVEWQATSLPGYIILYQEDRPYPDADVVARGGVGSATAR